MVHKDRDIKACEVTVDDAVQTSHILSGVGRIRIKLSAVSNTFTELLYKAELFNQIGAHWDTVSQYMGQ